MKPCRRCFFRQWLRWIGVIFMPKVPSGKDRWMIGAANSINQSNPKIGWF